MERLVAQLYEGDDDARCFSNDFIVEIRPNDGGELTRGFVGRVLEKFGYTKNKRWSETSWGWQAEYVRLQAKEE